MHRNSGIHGKYRVRTNITMMETNVIFSGQSKQRNKITNKCVRMMYTMNILILTKSQYALASTILSQINQRTNANLVLHMYAAANTVMTVNRILLFCGALKRYCIGRTERCVAFLGFVLDFLLVLISVDFSRDDDLVESIESASIVHKGLDLYLSTTYCNRPRTIMGRYDS